MRALTRFVVLPFWLLAACDELPAYDDPRDVPGTTVTPTGDCTGAAVWCEDRPIDACAGGGCEVVMGCQHASRQRCISYDDPDACDSDPDCFWIVDSCEERSTSCTYNGSQTACSQDPADCVWAPACDGLRDACFEATTPEECAANLGCEWS